MKCPVCETELTSDDVFCRRCGHRVDEGKDAADTAPGDTAPLASFRDSVKERQSDQADDREEEVWQGSYSPKAMLGSWLGGGLLAILIGVVAAFLVTPLFAIGICLLAVVVIFAVLGGLLMYRRLNVHYELTNQRFVHKSGVLRRVTDRIEVIDMDDVTFEQGIVQRFLGVGTIKITSSDRSHPELWMYGIDEVQRVAGLIDDVRRKERRRRGLHIESI